jgi:putative transposase
MDSDTRSATVYRCKAFLLTVDGQVECPFVLSADCSTPYERDVLSEGCKFRESTLPYDATTAEFYLNISMRRCESDENDEVPADTGDPDQTVFGSDLGVSGLAVSATGTFWQGDDYDHWGREFEKRHSEIQQRGAPLRTPLCFELGRANPRDQFCYFTSRVRIPPLYRRCGSCGSRYRLVS